MMYDELTLDWDYYMVQLIRKHKAAVLKILKVECSAVKILNTQKGINIIAKFKKPKNLQDLIFLRLYCFDDIFRIRNEIDKFHDNQEHRINRIWAIKNGFEKTTIFEGFCKDLKEEFFDDLVGITESKRPKKEVKSK